MHKLVETQHWNAYMYTYVNEVLETVLGTKT